MADPLNTEIKRGAFVMAGFWFAFHIFVVALWVSVGEPDALVAVLLIDGFAALVAFLYWLASRVFPHERGESHG